MAKNPFDMSEMMKAFDPDAMKKMFDPQAMMSMFQMPAQGAFDMTSVIDANKKHFEAMAEANQAAAEGYKEMLDRQMTIFQDVIAPAQKMVADASDPATLKARTEQMNEAVEQALGLMKSLAEQTRTANEVAFTAFRAHVDEAVNAATPKKK